MDLKQTITRGELADYVGDADGKFSAERVLKRAELAAILLRVDNELMSSDDREAGPDQQNRN